MPIFSDIEQLRAVAKVNRSTPWDVFQIYINDSISLFLTPYLGTALIKKIETEAESESTLLKLVQNALGPYAVAMATDEMSIAIGDNGHTVVKSDKSAPASDAKIEKARESLLNRAWSNMEILLSYLEENSSKYTEWREAKYHKNRKTSYFLSAEEFQDKGLIDINYSRLCFERIRMLIFNVEKTEVSPLLGDKEAEILSENEEKHKNIRSKIQAFIGARVAQLHTSKTTRIQRSKYAELEFQAVLRPLFYDDSEDFENLYAQKAIYWMGEILSSLTTDFDKPNSGKVDWDNDGKHIFFAG